MSEEQEQQQLDGITLSVDWHFPITSLKITDPLPGGRQLTRQLDVVVAYDDGEVVVNEPRFHIHAVGATRVKALQRIQESMV